ncbi:SDR family oxidoreductase [Blastococcus mobilis]|uniref:Short-chain dehydrogenase n=1 Tax=Blastococcus mobilis TaxID=1938746 RepID=A0A239AMD3_9ACTN|nr:SDR family oxidoreductase [Blastococcus mobilis]SNR96138.1 Short-chain dehydrogenase [Blastococcus mobilis]
MKPRLAGQVAVITGASSGIGRLTAQLFAARGAQVVLAGRGGPALQTAAEEVAAAGGTALVVPTDVADATAVQALADTAVERFGRIDTGVNNASVTSYGTVADTPVADIARVIAVNLLGQVHGIKAALPVMRAQRSGTIVAVSSGLGVRSVPLQVPDCAAKRAVVGLMEGARMEERRAGSGVQLTTILPSSINTPLFDHAPSFMGRRPAPIPPVYEPAAVAQAILFAAMHRRRDIYVGAAARQLDLLERLSPALADRLLGLGGQAFRRQQRDEADAGQNNLYEPSDTTGSVRGRFGRFAFRRGAYTRTFGCHPVLGRIAGGTLAVMASRRLLRVGSGKQVPTALFRARRGVKGP